METVMKHIISNIIILFALVGCTTNLEKPPQTAIDYIERGSSYAEQGKLDLAFEDFTKAIELDPESEDAYYSRGRVYADRGDWEHALQDYEKTLELNPWHDLAYGEIGRYFLTTGDFEQALSNYNLAIQFEPENNATHYYNRGLVYAELEEFELGIEDMTKAIEIDNHFAMAYEHRGLFYYYVDQSKMTADLKKALELGLPSDEEEFVQKVLAELEKRQ